MSRMKECSKDFKVVTEDEVLSGTGKGWEEWFRILDEAGIAEKGHDPMVKHLQNHYSLNQTWAQAVAMRYENDRGLRNHTT
jgi:hypothetical protein